jgi:hypothetical protein
MSELELLRKVNEIDERLNFLIELISDAFLTHEEYLILKEVDEIVKKGEVDKKTVKLDEV